ncbi:MAG TPA: ATP-binding protein, partial [Chitinophagaceae bacterium]
GTMNSDSLVGCGEMFERIRSFDWAETPLGPVESWSPGLLTTVNIVLSNRFPMLLWWGEEYISIYNDAYIPILGAKHPWALGQPVSVCWNEIWHVLQPLIDSPFKGGPSTWMEDILLEINRHGFTEETHLTIAYSPIPDEKAENRIGGVLATVHEISEKVVAERRVNCLRDLGILGTNIQNATEACKLSAKVFGNYSKDIPFALFYLFDENKKQLELIASSGFNTNKYIDPSVFIGSPQESVNNLDKIFRSEKIEVVKNLEDYFKEIPQGPWSDKPRTAAIIPLQHGKGGLLICGISSRLEYDEQYQFFFELIGNQISSAISSASAFEEERRRAEALLEIDKAKTVFFSNISHEFRTPLTLMLGPTEEALNDPDTIPQNKERLRVVQRNALRMQKLVNNLLDFSRIEAGRINASYEPVDLAEYTTDLASSFRAVIEKEGIAFLVDCPSLAKQAWVDKDMWEKIILNLLSNAFKFTWKGQIKLRLSEANGFISLEVEDSGVGIPAHEQNKVFDRFHRVEKSNGRTIEGTGIGLALVSELVKLHDGTITVDSKENHGSVFTVSIPFKNSRVQETRSVQAGISTDRVLAESYIAETDNWSETISEDQTPLATNNEKKYILVADDNADMRFYLAKMLSSDYEVRSVADGQAAWDAIRERKPHLVISDIMMPGMDGFELLQHIKSEQATHSTQVILLSARAGEEAINEGLQKGADAYLVKPFTGKQLKTLVQNRLRVKESQDLVEESEERFRSMANETPLFVWVTDDKLQTTFLNNTGFDYFNLDKEKNISHLSWKAFIHPSDIDRVLKIMNDAAEQQSPYSLEMRLKNGASGEYRWFLDKGIPRYNAGKFCGFIGTSLDIQDIKQAEELLERRVNERTQQIEEKNLQLQEQKDFVQTILDASKDVVVVFDEQLKFISINKTVEKLYNLSTADIVGKHLFEVFPKINDPELLSSLRQCLQGESSYIPMIKSTVMDRWFQNYCVPLKDTEGRTYGVVIIGHDITDITEAAEKVHAKNSELENTITMLRTQQLKDQQKDNFIQMASHELKTPLTSIKAYAQLLARTYADTDDVFLKNGLLKVENHVNKMTKLVGDFLNVTKMESGKFSIENERIDIAELAREVLTDLQMITGYNRICMESTQPIYVSADKEKIAQVLINFLNNAVKYSPVSEPVVINVKPAGTGWVTVSVADKGHGIPLDEQEKIFQRFYRSRNNNDNFSGFGIGLFISAEIIRRHNGKIGVSSKPGKGATFYFQLPIMT